MTYLLLAAFIGLSCIQGIPENIKDLKFDLTGITGEKYDEDIFFQKRDLLLLLLKEIY